MMQNMKSSNPDLPTTEIAKKLGEMWQKMSSNILDHSPLYYPSISIVSSVRQILQSFVIMFTAKTKAVLTVPMFLVMSRRREAALHPAGPDRQETL
jgi:hypothetical protein